MNHDYIIIGAGITGIYFAYRLYQKNIRNFIILDKNNYIGGRAKQVLFHGTNVQLGAGIITSHNTNLLNLIKELGLVYHKFTGGYKLIIDGITDENEQQEKDWYNKIIKEIDDYLKNNPNSPDMTCMEFIEKTYGRDTLKKMLKYAEYIEYFPASLKKTFRDYPIEDLYLSKTEIGSIKGGWKSLIDKLVENFQQNISLNSEVLHINYNTKLDTYEVITNNSTLIGKNVVLATDISLKNIKLTNISFPPIIDKIRSVPYFRLYTRHESHNVKENLLFFNKFRKIIPINKNILMSAYADLTYAERTKEYLNESNEEKKIEKINLNIQSMVADKYSISKIKKKEDYIGQYWKDGVHYFLPNYNYEKTYYVNNKKNFIICGEILSKPQGNVEACIQSVNDMTIDKIL